MLALLLERQMLKGKKRAAKFHARPKSKTEFWQVLFGCSGITAQMDSFPSVLR